MKRKTIIILLFITLLSFILSACGSVKYTVICHYADMEETFEFKANQKVNIAPLDENNYLFLGWFEDPEYTHEFECNAITQNLEIYAKTIEMGTQYRITYNLNGGRFDSTFSNKYYLGEGFDLPIPVYNKYYQFDGWLLNGEKISTISQTMYGDITVDATWKDISK